LAERTCIVTRKVRDEDDLIRFVRSPDGGVVPDLARKLPGRGVWVSLDRATVSEAVRRRLFAKGFHAEAQPPADLSDLVGRLLRQQALSLISMAKKAGEAVAGFTKVEDMLGHGRAQLLFHAAEASADGCRKLDKLAHPGVKRITLFHSRELDLAFGRSNVIHAAVAKGGLAIKLLQSLRRIETFEGPRGSEGPEETE
jgi:hypothetical protein